jgi:hypothetical protein
MASYLRNASSPYHFPQVTTPSFDPISTIGA